jgi:hypothetical protein
VQRRGFVVLSALCLQFVGFVVGFTCPRFDFSSSLLGIQS